MGVILHCSLGLDLSQIETENKFSLHTAGKIRTLNLIAGFINYICLKLYKWSQWFTHLKMEICDKFHIIPVLDLIIYKTQSRCMSSSELKNRKIFTH